MQPNTYYAGSIVIDMPKKKGQYHGSAYVIMPTHCYSIEGDAVTPMNIRNDVVQSLIDSDCDITDIHEYTGGEILPISKDVLKDHAHIYFKCRHNSEEKIMRILKRLPEMR